MENNKLEQVKEKPLTVKDRIQSADFSSQIAKVLPKHLTPDRFARLCLSAVTRNPKLLDCTQASVLKCMMDLSQLGIEPDGRRAHLIPYGNTCTLIIDYKGIVELVRRSGDVSSIHADVVCENDVFTYQKGKIVEHTIDFKKDRGAIYAVYVEITMKDGSVQCGVMSKQEVEAIRARSKSGKSGPWVTDWPEMAKKTVFKRESKWLTLSPEIRDAIDLDNEIDVTPEKPAVGNLDELEKIFATEAEVQPVE
jgi:recombination protein RecT